MTDKDKVLSDNPFNLYDILNKRKDSGDDLKYPPSFTPSMTNVEKVNKKVKGAISNKVNELVNSISNKLEKSVPKVKFSSNNSVCSKRVHTGCSILQLIDELVKDGDCVIMEDFNEVRMEQERYGSVFNVQGANAFNSFISLASLIDLPLDGYAYTWAHKTANKMSKLDRFLVSKGLLASFLYLSALCLDRNLSDHRHILMRELSIDYGPTPFRFFIVGLTWMVLTKWKKLQALKVVINKWTKWRKKSSYKAKFSFQSKLSDINKILDQGGSNEEMLSDRFVVERTQRH
ncbi:RNA-directed DNA polymerase, eukaryota [Tanacetum coccineum]